MQIIKKILVFLLIILGSQGSSLATHLMGGSLVYEYLGLNTGTGLYQYQVTVTIYRYCSGNPTPAQLPNIINLGVYRDDLNNYDDLTELEHILFIKIDFIDPQNISEVQELILEVPLAGAQ